MSVVINPEKSYLNLENTGTSDTIVSQVKSLNAVPGQVLVLDRHNIVNIVSGDSDAGKILLQGIINPNAEDDSIGNIRIPVNETYTDALSNGGDTLEIMYKRELAEAGTASGDIYRITKTVVTLMYDGSLWNVTSYVNNIHYETE